MTAQKPTAQVGNPTETAGCADGAAPGHPDHAALAQNEIVILAETFRLLGDPSRLKILLSCMSGPISVGDIAGRLDLSVSLVSHHLRLLRGARLVRGERQAKQIFYAIADQHVRQVLEDMATHIAEEHGDE